MKLYILLFPITASFILILFFNVVIMDFIFCIMIYIKLTTIIALRTAIEISFILFSEIITLYILALNTNILNKNASIGNIIYIAFVMTPAL